MSTSSIKKHMDRVLAPLGFARKGLLWNRTSDSLVEVIDLQVSKAGDSVTVNAGVFDPDLYAQVWGTPWQAAMVEEPRCAVRNRIGMLAGDRDQWWSVDDPEAANRIGEALTRYVLPFLLDSRSPMVMERTLEKMSPRYPLPRLHLAVLKHRRGDVQGACAVLLELQERALGGWRDKAADLAIRLGCAQVTAACPEACGG